MVEEEFGGSSTSKTVKFTDAFEKYAPVYMAMGMSYDDYWNDEVGKASDYREAFKLRKKQMNERLWMQGLYIYKALERIFPLFNAWAEIPPKPYLEYPIPLTEEEEKEQKRDAERKEMLKMQEYLEAQVRKGERKED